MRTIVLSAIIAVLALLPLALGLATGAAMQTPLVIAIISAGPLLAVMLVLLFRRMTGGPPAAGAGRRAAEPPAAGEARDLLRDETVWQGLTSAEAEMRLSRYGPNAVAEARPHPWLRFLQKFWAPVPCMLEATIALQVYLGKPDEAAIIGVLLVFNAALSLFHEQRANQALALLRSRLDVKTRVLRDGRWQLLSARSLVPGDVVHLRMGDLAPADIRLREGTVSLDQSALTGESLPVEGGPDTTVYAGSVIKRGESTGLVTGTGSRTFFGKTAELVRTAKTASHLEHLILTIVKWLVAADGVLVAALVIYAWATGLPFADVAPFALILLVASVPVALPATFTLATAFGALELAKRGVLVTRLSAIEEAAAMDVLCTDKTGTITQNRLAVAALKVYPPYSEDQLAHFAMLASDEATQDPIDLAILAMARGKDGISAPERLKFVPFDPAAKRSEAWFRHDGKMLRVLKGAPQAIAGLIPGAPDLEAEVERLAARGCRVLAVASGDEHTLNLAGLVALADPPREDSALLVRNLYDLGLRVTMVTGDGLATARAVAAAVGIGDRACPAERLRGESGGDLQECDVFAGVLPEDKFHLVQALQRAGHVAGMTGDGVNDAPALKQAEVGIAVANATDVAKAAASMVLTNTGLADVVAAVETSRRIYQRMLTYTLNKIIRTITIGVFLSLGVMLTGTFIVTPLLIVLLLFANDFVTMAVATDNVSFSRQPERWRIPTLMMSAGVMALWVLGLFFGVYYAGRNLLHLPLPQLQTLVFLLLVFSGQGITYLVRERRHFWRSRPSRWLALASILDIVAVSFLAIQGILMAPVDPQYVIGLLIAVTIYLTGLDLVKTGIFRHFGVH